MVTDAGDRRPGPKRGSAMPSRNRRTSWGHLAVAVVSALSVGLVPTLVAVAPPAGGAHRSDGTAVPQSVRTDGVIASALRAGGSIDEAWLTGAGAADAVTLLRNGTTVANPANPGTADSLGSLIIRNLTPGSGYAWDDTTTGVTTPPFAVLAPDADPAPNSTLYNAQPMHQGLNYITMRDGVQLAATVRYPFGVTCSTTAPCPTVIEYSGYGTAGPSDPISYLLASIFKVPCTGCGPQNLLPDSATDVGAVVARAAGFATVSLQMRGTGCSGGAYDLFGYPSDYDAYDAVEIVAHQSWVANHKVGMVGISYSGLSEFPSAGTDPPDLAAIAPMSPTDDLFSTGYPGGIYNSGFASGWFAERVSDAKPAAVLSGGTLAPLAATPVSGVGQPWTYYEMAAEGPGSTCLANQALHAQSQSLASLAGPQLVAPGTGSGRDPSIFDQRSMSTWARRITVPVFVSGAMQDEQTGPQWPALLSALPASTPVFANLINGGHIDSTGPQIISRWLEFLDLYVADKVPTAPSAFAGLVLDSFTSLAAKTSGQAPLPVTRFTDAPTLAVARQEFTSQTPRVHVLFDNGAGAAGPGNLESTYSADFAQWPPAGRTTTFWLGSHGTLTGGWWPGWPSSTSLRLDPSQRPGTSLPPGANAWAAAPGWNWTPVPSAYGAGFQTAPVTADTTIVGPATLNLWVASSAPVVDLQATITEVRPSSGQEEYVTSGFLRSSNQVDLPTWSQLFTVPTYLGSDARSLAPTHYRLVRIPIDPIVHTFRAGTALRVVLSAPGGDRPSWEFDSVDTGQQASLGLGFFSPSSLVVDVVPGVTAPATLPACGSLRGEPCRSYQPEGNQA